jgi:outer membrane protein insertion porin family
VAGAPDQVDLVVNVTEKPTGNLMIGAGYSSAEKLTLTASIKQDNVFGSGNYLGSRSTPAANRTLVLSTVDPYFTVDGISRHRLFYRTSRPINSLGESYELPPRVRRSASACRSPSTTPSSSASARAHQASAPRSASRTATS